MAQRVVLITGASSGIGLACGKHLAERGFRVYGTSRRGEAGTPAPLPQAMTMIPMDVTSEPSVNDAVREVASREGRLDIVVNNAGFGYAGPVEFSTAEEARRQFDVNVFGVLRVCRAALPIMRAQRAGYIVNIGSIAGVIAVPFQGLYSASKFALEGLSEALRLEASPFGVRVTILEPGDFRTAFTANRRRTEEIGECYRTTCEAALERMAQDEQHGRSPLPVARLVLKIVNTPAPRLRYTAGPAEQRAAVWCNRWLPNGIVERGLRAYYRLGGG
jgi:NAD(P)-dependent dehydrogenase (short-subunit alcohol dehydrogenase family)